MILYINLLNFTSEKIGGVGFFTKRIFERLSKRTDRIDMFEKIVILSSINIDPISVFSIPNSSKIKIVKVPLIERNVILRVLYEQMILPFKIKGTNCVFFSPSPIAPILLKIFKSKIPIIVTIHDLIPFKIKGKYSRLRSSYIKILTILSAKVASHIVTVSQNTKRDIIEILSIPPSKITVVFNFLNQDFRLVRYNLNNTIVSLSTIEPGKNYVNMIRGFLFFLEQFPEYNDYRYIIIGKKGWNSDEVFEIVENNKNGEKVIFKDYISEEEKFTILSKAQCLLFLSRYEGFGIPILEALYCNTPAIVLNNSSLPEVLGDSGIILDDDDPLSISNAVKEVIERRDFYCSFIPNDIVKFDPNIQLTRLFDVFLKFKL